MRSGVAHRAQRGGGLAVDRRERDARRRRRLDARLHMLARRRRNRHLRAAVVCVLRPTSRPPARARSMPAARSASASTAGSSRPSGSPPPGAPWLRLDQPCERHLRRERRRRGQPHRAAQRAPRAARGQAPERLAQRRDIAFRSTKSPPIIAPAGSGTDSRCSTHTGAFARSRLLTTASRTARSLTSMPAA